MAVINPPSYVQDGSHSAISDRLTVGALTMPGTSPVSSRGGVRSSLSGNGMKVIARTTPTAGVTVKAGVVAVPDAIGGLYLCHLTTDYPVNIAPASATQNRIDLIVARVYDPEGGDSGNGRWQPEVIQGTPSSGAGVAPVLPARCWPLAQVRVNASSGATAVTTSNIVDVRGNPLTATGGLMPVLSTAMPTSPHLWMAVYCTDVDEIRVWRGTKWSRYMPEGGLPAPAYATTNTNVTLPTGDYDWRYLPNRVAVDLALDRPALVAITISAVVKIHDATGASALISARGSGANVFAELTVPGRSYGDSGAVRFTSYGDFVQAQGEVTMWAPFQAGNTHVELRQSGGGSATSRELFGASLTLAAVRAM